MFENFFDIFKQVLVLFLLTGLGFICGRKGLIDEKGEASLAAVSLYIAMPCVIILSFQRSFEPALWEGFKVTLLATVGIYMMSILLTRLTIRDVEPGRRNVLQFSAVFSNCGFMALPLAQLMYGEEGVFYSAAIVAIFNLFLWTYGYVLMGSGNRALKLSKLLVNPGLLALVFGLIMFFFDISLPSPIYATVKHAANLNTPLGMLVVGSRLSRANLRDTGGLGSRLLAAGERLLVIPLLAALLLYALDIRGVAAVVCIIAACAPAASTTTMFALMFHHDEELSANTVSMQTLLSALTMPVVICIAQALLD